MTAISVESFSFVSDLVRRESAIVLETGKEYLVEARLTPMARQAGFGDVNELVRTLQTKRDPSIAKQVVEALTTNETSWFRDAEPFNALRTMVLPDLAGNRPSGSLRVWSAACSSGQEAYSIAITAEDTPQVSAFRLEILGTDLSEEMVQRARAGRYSQLEVNRGLPATALVKHFTRVGAQWQISPALAATSTFRTMNLMRPFVGLGGKFDIVFIRNVLIYFDLPTKRDILRRIRQVMSPDGYLFLGAAETTMGVDDGWERVTVGRSAVYRPVG
jgi:chemotaxis protein methyltransferase CheR